MLHNRTWTDATAEAEFWTQMERLESVSARLSSLGRWSLLTGGPFRRAALQRDLDAIRSHAEGLVARHTVVAGAPHGTASEVQGAAAPSAGNPLHTLAGMVVSLRQDRASRPESGEEKAI